MNGKNNTTPAYTRMSNFNPTAYQGNYYNSRPSTNFINTNTGRNTTNSFNRSTNGRPSFNNSNYSPMRSAPSNFSSGGGGGGGGAMRGGGMSRPGR